MYKVLVCHMAANRTVHIVGIALSSVGFCVGQLAFQTVYGFSESDKAGDWALLPHYTKLVVKQ
jgi:hypothetical protein